MIAIDWGSCFIILRPICRRRRRCRRRRCRRRRLVPTEATGILKKADIFFLSKRSQFTTSPGFHSSTPPPLHSNSPPVSPRQSWSNRRPDVVPMHRVFIRSSFLHGVVPMSRLSTLRSPQSGKNKNTLLWLAGRNTTLNLVCFVLKIPFMKRVTILL